jgi:acetolactate synthase-1/2/3 large subunit
MYGIQGFDSPDMVKNVTKYAKTIMSEENVQSELEYAYETTLMGRPGPVWLDFPFDIQAKTIEARKWNLTIPKNTLQYDAAPILIGWDLQKAIKLLSESKRPLIWGGHGVRLSGAKQEFRTLVDQLQIPTILTWSAIDLLSDDDPYYFGRAGVSGQRRSNFIVQNCDCIMILGSRMSLLQTGYDISKFNPTAKIIFVDIDELEWNKNKEKYTHFIKIDCKMFIVEFLRELKGTTFYQEEWVNYCKDIKAKYPLLEYTHVDGGPKYLNSYHFIDNICNYLKDDEIIVTDMGTGLLSGHYSIRLKPNQTMFTSLGLGEMGYGLPGAIGASFTNLNRQVLCLNCDGGMMMNLQELQTIIHHNLPIKIVVFNNDGYLMIKHTQKLLFKGSFNSVNANSGLSLPDFGKLGNAFGFETYKLDLWENFDEVITKFLGNMNPAICEVYMHPEQEFIPKVKGIPQDDETIIPASLEEMFPLLPFNKIKEAMPWNLSEDSKKMVRL